jgi:5,6,7,8-tetrahydromethanopterin hydro-lyase
VTVRTARQRHQIYEVAARGINKAIDWMINDGTLPEAILDKIVMIVNAFVHPSAAIERRIELNNFKAMRAAIRKAIEGRPVLEEILNEKDAARHPFKYAP